MKKQKSINLKNIQATPAAHLQKNKWPNQKMSQRCMCFIFSSVLLYMILLHMCVYMHTYFWVLSQILFWTKTQSKSRNTVFSVERKKGKLLKTVLIFYRIKNILSKLWQYIIEIMSLPINSDGKASTCNGGNLDLIPGSGWSPGEENVFLPGEFQEQRSLAGHSPLGCRVGHNWATNI